ncbi:hypothetical protein J6590_104367, partial [Homalodisca vitripennis]
LPSPLHSSLAAPLCFYPKALKTRLKRFLVSQAFYNAGEFLAFDWETAQLED